MSSKWNNPQNFTINCQHSTVINKLLNKLTNVINLIISKNIFTFEKKVLSLN